jgi:hypothetical protein
VRSSGYYSALNASIGSSLAAFAAGFTPNINPVVYPFLVFQNKFIKDEYLTVIESF